MTGAPALLAAVPTLDQIKRLEGEMLAREQVDIKTTHHFADGLYAREIFIPAGTLLTGKTHKGRHLNTVSQGEIIVWTEQGMKHLKAPCTFVSMPGTKRVGYAVTDCVWTCYHHSNETDLVKLEAELIEADALPAPETAEQIEGVQP